MRAHYLLETRARIWHNLPAMARRRRKTAISLDRSKRVAGKRTKKILIWSLCGLAGIFVVILAGYFWLMSWLQGDEFRQTMETELSSKLQSDVSVLAPLQIDGSNVRLAAVSTHGTRYIKNAEVKGIQAGIDRGALWNRILHAENVLLGEFNITIDNKKEKSKEYPEPEEGGFFSRFAPNTVAVDRVECSKAGAKLILRRTDPSKEPNEYTISGSTFTATPVAKNIEHWKIELRKGTFNTSHRFLAESKINKAGFEYKDNIITLTDCQLALPKGNMNATGNFNLKNKDWQIQLSAGNADISPLLSKEFCDILTGEFSGHLHMTGTRKVIHKAEGHITLTKGKFLAISALSQFISSKARGDKALHIPGQDKASKYLEKTFKIVKIDSADCDIRFPHTDKARNIENAWLFDKIDIRTQDDKIRLVGHVIIEQDGKLHGAIRIGISKICVNEFLSLTTEPFHSLFNMAIPKLFNASGEEGFHWININLSGTTDKPQQDLSARAKEVMASLNPVDTLTKAGAAIWRDITDKPKPSEDVPARSGQEESGNSLIETATDTATDVIKTGVDLIPIL